MSQVVLSEPLGRFSHLFIFLMCSLYHLFTFPKLRYRRHDVTTISRVPLLALTSKRGWLVGQSKNHFFNGGKNLRYKVRACAWTRVVSGLPFDNSPKSKVQKTGTGRCHVTMSEAWMDWIEVACQTCL